MLRRRSGAVRVARHSRVRVRVRVRAGAEHVPVMMTWRVTSRALHRERSNCRPRAPDPKTHALAVEMNGWDQKDKKEEKGREKKGEEKGGKRERRETRLTNFDWLKCPDQMRSDPVNLAESVITFVGTSQRIVCSHHGSIFERREPRDMRARSGTRVVIMVVLSFSRSDPAEHQDPSASPRKK